MKYCEGTKLKLIFDINDLQDGAFDFIMVANREKHEMYLVNADTYEVKFSYSVLTCDRVEILSLAKLSGTNFGDIILEEYLHKEYPLNKYTYEIS